MTGTSIRQIEGETALPVTVITRDQIDKSGATNALELLKVISANNSLGTHQSHQPGWYRLRSVRNRSSLRGLGGGAVLVLLNGHRLDTFAGEAPGVQGVNLSVIPFAAIERVEVLKDGASAIYGSDAIAGVINFITKSDYNGAEVTAQYGTPTRAGGGDQYSGSGSFGVGNLDKDKYNVFASLSYQHQKPLLQKDRDFSNSSFQRPDRLFALSSNQFPGNVTTGHIGVVNHGVPNEVRGANGCGFSANIVSLGSTGLSAATTTRTGPGVEHDPRRQDLQRIRQGDGPVERQLEADLTGIYSHDASRLIIQPGPISNVFTFGPVTLLAVRRSRCCRAVRSIRMPRPPQRVSTASRSTCATAPTRTATGTRPIPTRRAS